MLRVAAQNGLLSGKFRHGGLFVHEGQWSSVDANDEKIRATLLAFVPSHIRLAPSQDRELAAAGFEVEGGRLVDLRAAEKAAKETAAKAKEKPARADK